MNRESSEARKQIAAARSSGLPIGPSSFSTPLFTLGLFQSIGVSTDPGATAFTRMLRDCISSAKPRVKASIAPLEDAYATTLGDVAYACTELTLTNAEPGPMCATPYFEKKKTDPRLVVSVAKKSASAMSAIGPNFIIAASLTITSILP